MKTYTIDFETYYDRDFSLSKLQTPEYIYDPMFEVIGVAVADGANEPEWFTGTKAEIKTWLQQFDWENAMCIAHNAQFDGAILEWVFDIHPKMYLCTMMGVRPIVTPFTGRMSLASVAEYYGLQMKGTYVKTAMGKRRRDFSGEDMLQYAVYCTGDVLICRDIAKKIIPMLGKSELKIIDQTVKKFTRPKFQIDIGVVQERLARHLLEKEALLAEAGLTDRKLLMSNESFAAALLLLGVDPPTKISPTTGKEIYAFAKTDQPMQDLLDHPNSKVAALAAARLGHKSTLEQTRLERFISIAEVVPGARLPVPLLYYGAHTGRFSGTGKINLQNLPSRGEIGPALRRALKAPKGYKVIAGDLSQIEARLVAALANQDDLIEQFANKEDVYVNFAAKSLYHKMQNEISSSERFVGKCAILQLGYQSGSWKFETTMHNFGVDMAQVNPAYVVDQYRATFAQIKDLWYTLHKLLNRMQFADCNVTLGPLVFLHEKIRLPNGMYIHYPGLYRDANNDWWYYKGGKDSGIATKIYGGAMLENICQALARIIISAAEIRMSDRGVPAQLQVHDELVYVVKEEHVEPIKKALEIALTAPVPWMPNLPVACEIGVGDNYYEAK